MLQRLAQTIKLVLNAVSPVIIVATFTVTGIVYAADVAVQGADQLQHMVAQKSYSQALKTFSALSQEQQRRLDLRFYRATALAGVGQRSEAIAAFKELIVDEPQYPEFYNNLAMVLVNEGRLLEAQQTLESGLRSRENYAMLYNNLTVVFETMARRSYAKALRVNREHSPALSPLVALQGLNPPRESPPVVVAAADPVMVEEDVVLAMVEPSVDMKGGRPLKPQSSVESKATGVTQEVTVSADNEVETPTLNQQIEASLQRWIESWQSQDIKGYINSYSPGFKSRSYSSHQAWLTGRKEIIGRAQKIDISLEAINIKRLAADRVQTDFMMNYRSDGYSDRSEKRVVFKRIGGEWRIVRELTLRVMGS